MNARIPRALRCSRCATMTAVLATIVTGPTARGAPGDLDAAFANVGRFTASDIGGAARSIRMQGDEILLAGGFMTTSYGDDTAYGIGFAIRVSSSGMLDPEYLGNISGMVFGAALQEGKLVGVAGGKPGSHNESVAFRIGFDGAIDPSFGTDGVRSLWTRDWYDTSSVGSIDVDPDGRIVAAGSYDGNSVAMKRLLPNGDPDDTFGTSGVVRVPVDPDHYVTALRILSAPDGGYRAAYGEFDPYSAVATCRVLALTPSGVLDESFGDGGYATLGAATDEPIGCSTIALLPDGRLLVGGASGAHALVTRLLANGTADASFAIDTLAASDLGEVRALAIDATNGDVLVAGQPASHVPGALVVRLHADGSLDAHFGNDGSAWIDLSGDGLVSVNDLVVQSNGDPLVAGGNGDSPFVVRLVGRDDSRSSAGILDFARYGYPASEGDDAVVAVRRIGGKVGAVSVDYRTSPGSAAEGEDYSAVTGRLDWADGDASEKTILVPVTASAGSPEDLEFFTVELSEPAGGGGLGTNLAFVEIAADGAPAGQFAIYDSFVDEGNPTLQVGIYRNYYATGAVSVTVTPQSGTATLGDDFTAQPVTVSWSDGEDAVKVIEIPITDDTIEEPEESFKLELSAATGGAVIGPHSTATISIADNDAPTVPPEPDDSSDGGSGGGGATGVGALLLLCIGCAARWRRFGAPPTQC